MESLSVSTCSGNSEVLFGILPPEMVPLRVGVVGVSLRDAQNLFHDRALFEGSGAQLGPVPALAALDNVVESGERIADDSGAGATWSFLRENACWKRE